MGEEFIEDAQKLETILKKMEQLNHIKDLSALLNTILYEARAITGADAGSIFLRQGDVLEFSYVQNDTLALRDEVNNNKYIYNSFELPINKGSIAGYVAKTGSPLNIKDVYYLEDDVPYTFNSSYDEVGDYRTTSMLTVPLITSREQVTGVMQIINAKDKEGNVTPFSEHDRMFVSFFANNASVAIERAKMTQEMILRMIKMAELRDPKETGNHVQRVASYAIEIYQRWAKNHNLEEEEVRHQIDHLRIAAMLHDVGKVAIPDAILKKPGKLDAPEYSVMKTHCYQGAKLFHDTVSELDALSASIAYTHHEKWNGKGYPRGLKGEAIPLAGRITAIADVFDALVSARVYKEAWTDERALKILKEERGEHFDPELIDIFFEIYDVITAIRLRYCDKNDKSCCEGE